jgi:glycosyltransferase involved in cell wall biosynthesis
MQEEEKQMKEENKMKNEQVNKRIKELEEILKLLEQDKIFDLEKICLVKESQISVESSKGDEGYFDRIAEMLKSIPESNGGRFYKKINTRIGIICDEFFYNSIFAAADFVYFSPDNWEENLDKIDCFLLISTWKGRFNEEWRGSSTEGSLKRMLQYKIIEKCKEKNIPTLFYSKEDPTNYARYIDVAKRCDYIFTTAEECIKNYINDCGHSRVFALRFGINPVYHNPVGFRHFKKQESIIFSGSWMAEEAERCKDLGMIFDAVIDAGKNLKIIDRMYKYREDWRYRIPDKYLAFASPSIEHNNLQKVHKLYDWAININTVKTSNTMFANRVYELQATGNLLLSNYSVGVNSRLPTVFMVHSKEEVGNILRGFTPDEIYERQISGIRRVMTGETCYDRVREMLEKIGIQTKRTTRRVAVIADNLSPAVRASFDRQTYLDKELLAREDVTEDILKNFDIIAFFSEEAHYGVFYLEDMINGFKYTNSDYITKDAYFAGGQLCPGLEHEYVSIMKDKYRSVFWRESFRLEQLLALEGQVHLPNGYSIDRFNFDAVPSKCNRDKNYKLSVIIPVYNNGWHLYGKAFASLRRSTMFDDMEIILVDDGSTDSFTPKMVEHLADSYENVRTFFYGDGGSGSASRPRNKGMELATAEYIAFLDPDDEIITDGFTKLYFTAVNENLDLISANRIKLTQTYSVLDYYRYHQSFYGDIVAVGQRSEFLKYMKFDPVGIHTMIIKKQIILNNHLHQIPGAIGEDSLFSWQVIYYSRRARMVPYPIHVYYASTTGSIVNSIGKEFFAKHRRLIPFEIQWLNSVALLNSYMDLRFSHYYKGWILSKLTLAKETDARDCVKVVYDMLCMYKDYYNWEDQLINRFIELCNSRDYMGAFDYICGELGTKVEQTDPDKEFFSRISDQIKDLPRSNGGRYYKKSPLKVGVISDVFLYNTFKDAMSCTFISPGDWETAIEGVDLFFFITGWRGLENEWRGLSDEDSINRKLLYRIIKECKDRGIPTVFYSIEDPPNYEHFIGIAKKCDFVFTTAKEMIPKYVNDCNHERVYNLPFCINPLFHNPVGFRKNTKRSEVIFSGSWMEKYPERCSDMRIIFDGVLRSGCGLKIIDRNFYINNANYKYPSKYTPNISPAIEHDDLQKVHKLYDWAINMNSVKESATMFANRAYELQASGNLMLSNYSVGINSLLPMIHIVQNSEEIPRILNCLTPEETYERQVAGIRLSMTGETCFDRFAVILEKSGFSTEVQERSVAVIVNEITPRIQEMFDRQSLQNKTLLQIDAVSDRLLANFDIVAFFDEDMDYFEFYLEDMCNGFKYTDSDYITKDAYMKGDELVKGVEHDYVGVMRCKYRTVFWRAAFTTEYLLSLNNETALKNGYSIDHFNYNAIPIKTQKTIRDDYKLSVIIPVLNDGKRLYGKSFASLRRSSLFKDMQILLIDCGSSDGYSDKMVSYIERSYDNVQAYFYNQPVAKEEGKRKGIELARASWISFLNPESEVVGDGYAKLIKTAEEHHLALVLGDVMEFDTKHYLHRYSDLFDRICQTEEDKVKLSSALLRSSADIQSAIINKTILNKEMYDNSQKLLPDLVKCSEASMVIPETIVNIYKI